MIGQTERDDKGVEAQFMKKKILALLVCSMLTLSTTVSADILDYEGTINAYKQDNKTPQTFEIDNGSGEKVTAVAKSDKVSVSAKATYIRSMPGKNGKKLARVYLGTGVERVAVCDNGWSKVTYEKKSKKGTEKISGYVPTKHINDSDQVAQARGTFTALKDSDILDYPGKKDGQIVGEVIQEDEVKRLATVNGIWSQIYYKKENGKRGIGYIPTSVLENTAAEENTEESKVVGIGEVVTQPPGEPTADGGFSAPHVSDQKNDHILTPKINSTARYRRSPPPCRLSDVRFRTRRPYPRRSSFRAGRNPPPNHSEHPPRKAPAARVAPAPRKRASPRRRS